MIITRIWTIHIFLKEMYPKDFLIFIENKYVFKDPLGEHIYLPLGIWGATNHIIPPGEIADSFNEIIDILVKSGADMFTVLHRKNLLGLQYMMEEEIRVLEIEKISLSESFRDFILDKFEYKGVDKGDHLYSLESIWLKTEDKMPEGIIKDEYFEIWKEMREKDCGLFYLTDVY